MKSLGEKLKQTRIDKQYSLEEINQKTKISIDVLEDIEKNNFKNLGGYGYAKAIVVSYGRILGINDKTIINYLNYYFDIDNTKINADIIKYKPQKKILIPYKWIFYIILSVVISILGSIVLVFHKNDMLTFSGTKENIVKQKIVKETKPLKKPKSIMNIKTKIENKEKNKKISDNKKNKVIRLDKTDYVNDFMFSNKESPLNVKTD